MTSARGRGVRLAGSGLKPDTMYRVATLDGELSPGTPAVASGSFWMQYGVDVDLGGDFQGAAFTLEAVAP